MWKNRTISLRVEGAKMKTNELIHPERLSHFITRFYSWQNAGWNMTIRDDGTWKGEREK
jgi:hypothetical protein